MTRYWIVVENTHEGPFTAEELKEKNISPDTYAWYPGLPKWTQAKDIEELAVIFVAEPEEEPMPESKMPEAPEIKETVLTTPPPPPVMEPAATPASTYSQSEQERVTLMPQPSVAEVEEKKPASYLAWSIITTILFFMPLGIVAIIFSSKVSSEWVLGNRDKARKSSEMAAWFSNIAFVVGLIWIPFSITFSMIIA